MSKDLDRSRVRRAFSLSKLGARVALNYGHTVAHAIESVTEFRVAHGDAVAIGMGLTESLAMTPAASVCGFYLSHPQAVYFNVGRIGDDQLADWAARNALDVAMARRMLEPQLG